MGFEDLAIASYTHPPLTTVRQPKRQMGRTTTEILFNLLNGSTSESSLRVQGELIVRESTAPSVSLQSPQNFGVISSQLNQPRIIQLGLRVDF